MRYLETIGRNLGLSISAGFLAMSGASAADLGVKKPAPVDFVKTCPAYGAGFFVVPGTTSCLRVIGRVRFEFIYDEPQRRSDNSNRHRARGYLGYDHRVATEFGLLRTFVRAFIQRENGSTSLTHEFSFIQLGGLTVGRITPIFEHGWYTVFSRSGQFLGALGSDITYVNAIGYTAKLANGISATVSVDDRSDRNTSITLGPGATLSPGQTTILGGKRFPDIVVALGVNQSWGEVKLAGAVREVRGTFVNAVAIPVENEFGYAFTAGAKINLPFLAKGSNFWVNFAYAEGAAFYTHDNATTGVIADRTVSVTDATVDSTGNLRLARSFSVAGQFEHFFTPTISAAIAGVYGEFDPFGPSNTVRNFAVAGNVSWRPVAGFLIGGEVGYRSVSNRGTAALAGGGNDNSDYIGRVRFQRDF